MTLSHNAKQDQHTWGNSMKAKVSCMAHLKQSVSINVEHVILLLSTAMGSKEGENMAGHASFG